MTRLLSSLLAATLLASPSALAGDAPDFSLRNLEREVVTLSGLEGKVVLLDFWATWCEPCKKAMPHLQAMQDELGDQGFVVLTVNTDDARSGSQVKPYIKRQGYTFEVLRDPNSDVLLAFNPAKTMPLSVLIDRNGDKHSVHSGYSDGDEVALRAEVVALLAAGAGTPAPAPIAPAPVPAAPIAPVVPTP